MTSAPSTAIVTILHTNSCFFFQQMSIEFLKLKYLPSSHVFIGTARPWQSSQETHCEQKRTAVLCHSCL